MSAQDRWIRILLRWLRTLLIYILILFVAGFLGNLWMTRNQAGGQAPLLSGPDIQGQWQQVHYTAFDQPLLLYFFADWCPICKFQHAEISAVNQHYPVVAIAMQSGSNAELSVYLQQQGLDLELINDRQGDISRRFGVQGVPASFIINNKGEIAFSTRGYTSRIGLYSRLWIAQWLD